MTSIVAAPRIVFGPAAATVAIAVSAVCFGLVPLFARQLQALGVDPAAIAFYRYAFTAAVMLPFLPIAREKRRQAATLAIAGMLTGLGWVGYLHAIETQPVAAAGVVYMSYPVFALLFAWLFLKQTPSLRSWAACVLVLLGASLLIGFGESDANILALLWSLPAPITFGLIIVVLSAMVPDLTVPERLACGIGGAVVGLAPLAAMAAPGALLPASGDAWLAIVGMGVLTALLPQMIYTFACPRVGPARAAATGAFELPTMIAVGWLAFSETVGLRELAAAAMVLAAILLAPAIGATHGQDGSNARR